MSLTHLGLQSICFRLKINMSVLTRSGLVLPMSRVYHAQRYMTTVTMLRDYQQQCIETCLQKFANGERRQVVSLPVGSGKTVVMANLIPRIPPPFPGASKVLILAHRSELLDQARNQIQKHNHELNVVVDQSKRKPDIDTADVIVASVQTLGRKDSPRLERYDPKEFKAIIIDEAHHAAAATYTRILDYFDAANPSSPIFVWGCSATVRRHDGISLSSAFDSIAYHLDFLSLIDKSWLCPLKITTVQTNIDLSHVPTRYDGFQMDELSKAVNVRHRNDIILQSYLQYAHGTRSATLVFAVDMAHTLALCNLFRKHGIESEYVTSRTPQVARYDILSRFQKGQYSVLVNCGILTEGTDIPLIDCILMARPTRSSVLFQQMFGRGMRLHNNKKDCLVIDFVDNFERSGKEGLVTFPTLLGLDSSEVLQDEDVLHLEQRANELESQYLESRTNGLGEYPLDDAAQCVDESRVRIKITEYDDLGELLIDVSGAQDVQSISMNRWVAVGATVYALQIMTKGTLTLKQEPDSLWGATFQYELGDGETKRFFRPYKIKLQADSRDSAIRAADTWVEQTLLVNKDAHLKTYIRRHAPFRQAPATPRQLHILKRFKMQTPASLTKGQAMDLITRLKLGQGKIWKQQAKEQRKRAEKASKTRQQQALRRTAPLSSLP